MHPGTDMERVRHVLSRELETINEYEQLAREAESPAVRDFLFHLAAEEKEHVTEAVMVLRQLDPRQEAYFAAGVEPGHFASTQEGPAPKTAPAPTPPVSKAVPAPAPPSPNVITQRTEPVGARNLTVGGAHDNVLPPVSNLPPQHVPYAQPAPPAGHAAPFTVGSLKRRR